MLISFPYTFHCGLPHGVFYRLYRNSINTFYIDNFRKRSGDRNIILPHYEEIICMEQQKCRSACTSEKSDYY